MMKKKDFVHLHLHSHFSLNDGIECIEKIVNKGCEQSMQALALTDHNSLAGAVEFTKKCTEKEIKPILGCEINLASERKSKYGSNIFHLMLLIENESGYKNLVKLITRAHQRKKSGLLYITYEDLKENKRGLIALTGCERGELISAIIENRPQDTEETFKDLLNIFTKENLYIELQNYQSYGLIDINRILIELANFLELPIVATQNVHYLEKSDRLFYEFISSTNPESPMNPNFIAISLGKRDKSFSSTEEIHRIFSYLPDAIENSLKIAQRCNFHINIKKKRFFKHDLGRGFDSDSYLLDFISKELDKKYPELDKRIKEELNYELQIIKEEEISNSFLILIAIQKFLVDNEVEAYTPGGWLTFSLVGFLIGLNNINPELYKIHLDSSQIIKNKTLEIEIGIPSEFLKSLVNYIFKSYSNSFICIEGEYLYWNRKELLMALHNWVINKNKTNLIFESNNVEVRFIEPDMLGLMNQTPTEEQIEQYLERIVDNHLPIPFALSQTEFCILFSGEPLLELIPIEFLTPYLSVSQYDTKSVNELGIIRINLKKNFSLDILNDAIYFIKQNKMDFALKKIPLSDAETYSLLSKGNTNGIPFFQNIKIKSELKSAPPQNYNQLIDTCSSFFKDKLTNAEIVQNVYVSYCLSYLKTHYPAEFFASALTHYSKNLNSYNILVKEAKNSGIKFLPVDINFSDYKFSKQGDAIRTGLCLIKNFSPKVYCEIDNVRKGGLFDSLIDLITKTDKQIVTKDILRNLIMAGTLENLNSDRYALLNQLENISASQSHNYQDITKNDNIEGKQSIEMLSSWLDLEYDATGTTLSQGLLDYYLPFGKMIGAIEPEEFQNVSHREQTSVLGLFDNFEENGNIKKDNFICLDLQGIEVRVNEEIFLKDKDHINSDLPVLVVGRKIIGEKGEYLFVKRVYDIRKLVELAEAPHILELDLNETTIKKQKQLLKILNQYKGKHKIIIKTITEVNKRIQKRIEKQTVLSCPNLINELSDLLGEENVKIRLDFANK